VTRGGRLDLAKVMLDDFNADINQCQPSTAAFNGYSALHWAASKGHKEMVEFLLKRKADKDIKDKHNKTALALAQNKGEEAIMALLG
jgi:ankyrin repeat protein